MSYPECEFLAMISDLIGRPIPGFVAYQELTFENRVIIDHSTALKIQISLDRMERALGAWIILTTHEYRA